MSADNRLLIAQDRWGDWCVWNASMEYSQPPWGQGQSFQTKREAEVYMDTRRDDYFEYGHQSLGNDEIRVALTGEIANLTERLKRLDETGCQWDKTRWMT